MRLFITFVSPGKGKMEEFKDNFWGLTEMERQNAATLVANTTIKPFIYNFYKHYKCLYCDDKFPDKEQALPHIAEHPVPDRATLLKDFINLKGRKILKVDASVLKCRICYVKFNDIDEIRKHLATEHDKEFNSAGNGMIAYDLGSKVGAFICFTCREEFGTFYSLNQHVNVHFNSFICETCGSVFPSFNKLWIHKNTHADLHECEECGESFPNKVQMRCHMAKAHEKANSKKIKPLQCPRCPERFSEPSLKLVHMKEVHEINFTFQCSECELVFSNRTSLIEHGNKVHKQKINCEQCNQCFDTINMLKIHLREHSNSNKEYMCGICQKGYNNKKYLNVHVRNVHTTFCKECNFEFHNREDFKQHKKEYHPYIPSGNVRKKKQAHPTFS